MLVHNCVPDILESSKFGIGIKIININKQQYQEKILWNHIHALLILRVQCKRRNKLSNR